MTDDTEITVGWARVQRTTYRTTRTLAELVPVYDLEAALSDLKVGRPLVDVLEQYGEFGELETDRNETGHDGEVDEITIAVPDEGGAR